MTTAPSAEERLATGTVTLPTPPTPTGHYVPAMQGAGLLEISGQVAFEGGNLTRGRVGQDITTQEAVRFAEVCAQNAVGIARAAAGSLDSLALHRVRVFVACTPDYAEQHVVADGASSFLKGLFGPQGLHARTAIGVQALPLGAPVEVEVTFRIEENAALSAAGHESML